MTEYNVEKMYTYLKGYITGAGFTESMKALGYAKEKHEGQFRKDGVTPYIIHPLNTAIILTTVYADTDTLIAGLLHDTIEDCSVEKEELEELKGEN